MNLSLLDISNHIQYMYNVSTLLVTSTLLLVCFIVSYVMYHFSSYWQCLYLLATGFIQRKKWLTFSFWVLSAGRHDTVMGWFPLFKREMIQRQYQCVSGSFISSSCILLVQQFAHHYFSSAHNCNAITGSLIPSLSAYNSSNWNC